MDRRNPLQALFDLARSPVATHGVGQPAYAPFGGLLANLGCSSMELNSQRVRRRSMPLGGYDELQFDSGSCCRVWT